MLVHGGDARSRLTTFFRFFLLIPHLIWFTLWGAAMYLALPVQWGIALVKGRPNASLSAVYAQFLRYTLHVSAYGTLAADRFPDFLGAAPYPVDVTFAEPEPQNRWSIGFRAILAFPTYVFAGALGSAFMTSAGTSYFSYSVGLAIVAASLAWFAILARGTMPAGLQDAIVWALGYAVQSTAYFFLLTGAYPTSDPRAVPLRPRPRHPIRLANADEPRRHRLVVAFRLPLMTPHFVWLTLWGVVALLAGMVAWLVALFTGRVPAPLHRFLAAFVRYTTHAYAFLYLAGGPYPGFLGRAGSYPLDIEIDGPEPQGRWTIAFRWILAIPALMLAAAMSGILTIGSIGAWWYALFRGRVPDGLHHALAYALRYSAMAYAHALLVTGTYPHSGPSEAAPPTFLTAPEYPLPVS